MNGPLTLGYDHSCVKLAMFNSLGWQCHMPTVFFLLFFSFTLRSYVGLFVLFLSHALFVENTDQLSVVGFELLTGYCLRELNRKVFVLWVPDSNNEFFTFCCMFSITFSLSGILNFCANNYLGLSSHPEVVQAGIDALRLYGAGLSSVRFICGTQVWWLMHSNNTLTHARQHIAHNSYIDWGTEYALWFIGPTQKSGAEACRVSWEGRLHPLC